MNIEARIIEPGQIDPPGGETPFLVLPAKDLFTRRADRLRFLSKVHPLGEYLAFLAKLSDAQHEALNKFPVRTQSYLSEPPGGNKQTVPPLEAVSLVRDPAWRSGLAVILDRIRDADLPPNAHATAAGLMQTGEPRLEEMADRILAGEFAEVSPQELPFVAAALQVSWVQMASSLQANAFGRLEHGSQCPVCGSHPMVGIVLSGGTEQGLRYLVCSLCGSQWHFVRIKCSSCGSTDGLGYYTLDDSRGSIKAESCDNCSTYLKLLYLEQDPGMEATADDLATLSLDMLMDKEGKMRAGANVLFHPGKTELS